METIPVPPTDQLLSEGVQPQHSLSNLFSRRELGRFSSGATLFREGDLPTGVYILHAGQVDLVIRGPGDYERVRTAGAGQILGLTAVISGRRHLSSAIAKTHCEVAFVESEAFLQLIDGSPAMRFSILRQLSQDVRESYEVIRQANARAATSPTQPLLQIDWRWRASGPPPRSAPASRR